MKKVLFVMGAAILMGGTFVACGNSDCTCKVTIDGVDAGAASVTDFDGDCDEVTLSDLGTDASGDRWDSIVGATIVCEED